MHMRHQRWLRGQRQIEMMIKLERLARFYDRVFSSWLKEFDLTSAQFRVLRQIGSDPHFARSIGDIRYRLGWGEIDVSRIVDRFERRGLIKRCMDERDRRSVRVQLLPEGIAFVKELESSAVEFHVGFCSTIESEDLDLFESCLDNLLAPGYLCRWAFFGRAVRPAGESNGPMESHEYNQDRSNPRE